MLLWTLVCLYLFHCVFSFSSLLFLLILFCMLNINFRNPRFGLQSSHSLWDGIHPFKCFLNSYCEEGRVPAHWTYSPEVVTFPYVLVTTRTGSLSQGFLSVTHRSNAFGTLLLACLKQSCPSFHPVHTFAWRQVFCLLSHPTATWEISWLLLL